MKENNSYKVSYSLGIITPEDVELANKKIMERGLDTLEEIYARNEIVIGENKINLMPSLTEEAINTAYKRSLKLHE